jgi:uncharacterized membrane protein YdjX (TVP38/TMEM64 family)
MVTEKPKRNYRWWKLGLTFLAFLIVSIGVGYVLQSALAGFKIPVDIPLWLALLIVFGVLAVINVSVLPLPFGISVMLVAASHWNPILVALVGSLGASVGEFSSYFFGYLGKRVSITEDTPGYKMIHSWITKYGMWAIALLSFQPVLPFEIGGFIAGLAKMPIKKFLPAIMIGKFPKYLLIIYLGHSLLRLLRPIHF